MLGQIALYSRRALRQHHRRLDAAAAVFVNVLCQFDQPAAAVRSPGAAMEGQQQPSFLQQGVQSADLAEMRGQLEWRSDGQR